MKASVAVPWSVANASVETRLQQNWNDQSASERPDVKMMARSTSHNSIPKRAAPKGDVANSDTTLSRVDVQQSAVSPVSNASPTVVQVPNLFRSRKVAGRSLNTLQEWEGLVTAIYTDTFTGRLRDLTSGSSAEEVAEIPFDEIDARDRENLQIGAVFHLIVGYTKRSGSQRRETMIYFRRHLPKAKSNGMRLLDLLKATSGDID